MAILNRSIHTEKQLNLRDSALTNIAADRDIGLEIAGALSGLGALLGTGGGTAGMAGGMAVAGAGMTAGEAVLLGLGTSVTVVGAGMALQEQIEASSKSLGDLVVESSGDGDVAGF